MASISKFKDSGWGGFFSFFFEEESVSKGVRVFSKVI